MGLRDIFRLEESTVRAGRRIYNFLIRAVSYGIAIVILGGVSVGLNFLLGYAAWALDLDEKTQTLIRAGSGMFFVVLVVAALLFAIGDVLKLVWYYFSGREDKHDGD